MGEQPPVFGIHEEDQHFEMSTGEQTTSVFYDPEDPDDILMQGGVLQTRRPSIR